MREVRNDKMLTAEGVDVVMIQPSVEETNQEVVEHGEGP
jgi:hypothetical protein